MSTYTHMFDYSQSLLGCTEYLALWAQRDTTLVYRRKTLGEPVLHPHIRVTDLGVGVVEVAFLDGRLSDVDQAEGIPLDEVMYARLEVLPRNRVLVSLSCQRDEFLPHWEQLLANFGELNIPALANKNNKDETESDKQHEQEKEELPIPDEDELLTDRQIEVAHLVADGLSNEEIAEKLVISPYTAKTHRRDIGGKWGKNSGLEYLQKEAQDRGYGTRK